MKLIYILVTCFIAASCSRDFDAPVPGTDWDLFDTPSATELPFSVRQKIEGVYSISDGSAAFGNNGVVKWSYTANGIDTTYHLSIFCETQSAYFICEGRKLDSNILLNGYWRRLINTQTGRAQFTVTPVNGSRFLLGSSSTLSDSLILQGVFGMGEAEPTEPLRLKYQGALRSSTGFEIIAHRGGGRTADLLPASENSVEMIRLASQLGATGVELDIQLTKDGVPILFHDITLNERVVQNSGLLGPIKNYTYDQLSTIVRLTRGEKIPTLREALTTVLEQTPLRFVWLDTKFVGQLQLIKDIQVEFLQKAAARNRNLQIYIGIPDADVLNNFKALPNYQSIPSIVELTPADVEEVQADVWAPQWTLGLQNDEVAVQHSKGRKVYTWTMDVAENIKQYMSEGFFDGILSNYPSMVAYYYYARP